MSAPPSGSPFLKTPMGAVRIATLIAGLLGLFTSAINRADFYVYEDQTTGTWITYPAHSARYAIFATVFGVLNCLVFLVMLGCGWTWPWLVERVANGLAVALLFVAGCVMIPYPVTSHLQTRPAASFFCFAMAVLFAVQLIWAYSRVLEARRSSGLRVGAPVQPA